MRTLEPEHITIEEVNTGSISAKEWFDERRKDWHHKVRHGLAFMLITALIASFFFKQVTVPDWGRGVMLTIVAFYFFNNDTKG